MSGASEGNMADHSRQGRKGRTRAATTSHNRSRSVQYPESMKRGDDCNEDVAAINGNPGQSVNQSVFSMIARGGSTTNFHKRFDDDESSDSDDEPPYDTKSEPSIVGEPQVLQRTRTALHLEAVKQAQQSEGTENIPPAAPGLVVETVEDDDHMSRSMLLPPPISLSTAQGHTEDTPQTVPAMRQAESVASNQTVQDKASDESSGKRTTSTDNSSLEPKGLPEQLKEIFGFEGLEEVTAEYPCWLTQNVLLQGYMYITQRHVCFYAYAPKKTHAVVKSGHLSKRGKQNPKYTRYWFELKGDELSYRTDPSDPYFRSGNIDLRFGISASLADAKDRTKGTKDFSVVTPHRDYHFRADSTASAKEWVKQLQRVIFRSHNRGDSVKISMPIENIMDVEEAPVMEVAETVKIRVADADENFPVFAVEEYYFTFFGNGAAALQKLQASVQDTTAQNIPEKLLIASPVGEDARSRDASRSGRSREPNRFHPQSPSEPGTPLHLEPVRATLEAYPPSPSSPGTPRFSGEGSRSSLNLERKSLDVKRKSIDMGGRLLDASPFRRAHSERGRRSASNSRVRPAAESQSSKSGSQTRHESVDSKRDASDVAHPPASGSQILERSELFSSPTMNRLQTIESRDESEAVQSAGTSGRRKPNTLPPLTAPVRSHSDQSLGKTQGKSETVAPGADITESPVGVNQWVKAGNYPLQRAAGFAGFLKTRSKKLSSRLATGSLGYVEKMSGVWAGGGKHYSEQEAALADDLLDASEAEDNRDGSGDRFRAYFALPAHEKLRATYFGWLHRGVPIHGKIYISRRNFCFRSLFPGSKTRMVMPIKDMENVYKEKGFRFSYSGLVIIVRGHEEIFFDFKSHDTRNDCVVTLLKLVEHSRDMKASAMLMQEERLAAESAKAEHQSLQAARKQDKPEDGTESPDSNSHTVLFDDPRASILNFKPSESLRITCLTIGSRGDVQPYIALCKGLLKEGHKPRIATHLEFKDWVEKHGIEFRTVEGDPAELMRICVENGMFTFSFLKEASAKFRGWIDDLLSSAWTACQDSDLLIESPSAMGGYHIAEALAIPYYRAFTMPWTRTRAYPHAFVVPAHKKGGTYNEMSYFLFDQVFWKAIAGQVNRWRKKELGLRSTDLTKMAPHRIPFLYNFSPKVVAPPLDYSDWVHITGYWFLDEGTSWEPSKELLDFIAKARSDEKKIVYIGFGSIVVSDPAALTKTVIDSVLKADVRCILSKGWSDRLGNHDAGVPEVPLPAEILQIKSAPHDWLFKQIDAATHHGGAGTTGASLRAGLPTIVKPFFGDQFFFGARIEDLGVGICLKKLNVTVFSRALWEATHSQRMISKASLLGEQIRAEDGVETAIQTIYRDLDYARSLIKRRAHITNEDNSIHDEEWTLIGDEEDPELVKRIYDFDISQLQHHGGDGNFRGSFQFGPAAGGGAGGAGGGRGSLDLGA